MSDERLRELERAWKESGCAEDEAAWLIERVRQGESLDWDSYSRLAELNVGAASEYLLARVERGDLEREKLELAAYCSHEPARVALGEEAPEAPGDPPHWLLGVGQWGQQLASLALVEACATILERSKLCASVVSTATAALASVRAWCLCPCPNHARSAKRIAETLMWDIDHEALGHITEQEKGALWAAHVAALTIGEDASAPSAANSIGLSRRTRFIRCVGSTGVPLQEIRASVAERLVHLELWPESAHSP